MPAPLSFKNDDKADERLNPATNLKAQEQQVGSSSGDVSSSYVNAGIDQAESFANDPANHSTTENIDNAKDRESASEWRQNFTGKGGGAKKFNLKGFARKKGPIGLIISLLLGGGILGGSFFGPAIALIHIKEVVENKVDTMASVVDTRMQKIIASRMKAQGVSGKCSGMIKIKCRFNTFSEEQLASMKEQGIKVVDGNGKEIEAGTKPTGEARMILQDGESIKASEFATKIKSDASFRNSLRDIYPTRFNVWNDRAAGLFEKAKGLIRDPKSIGSDEGGDPKKNQTEFNENLQEETAQGQNPTTSIDEGQYGNQINEEEANISQEIKNGDSVTIPTDATGAAGLNVTPEGAFSKIKGFALNQINMFSIVNTMCTSRSYLKTIVTAAKIPALIQEMRFASIVLATADKIKAGNATPNDVSQMMNMFEKPNKYGLAFGDSTGYNYAEYGKTTSTPVEAGATGSTLLTIFSNSLRYFDGLMFGISSSKISLGCNAFTSVFGQIIESLISIAAEFFSGGLVSAMKDAATDGTMAVAKAAIDQVIKNATEKFSKDAIKDAVKGIIKGNEKKLALQAGTMAGFFVAGFFISRYFVPYLAHLATGTLFSGDMDGVAAMDTLTAGAGAMNAGVSQSRGMTTMSPSQALAFMNFNNKSTATYVADMEAQANPFDITNPYSLSNSVGFTIGNFFSNFNILKDPASILTAPSSILSSILHPTFNVTASATSTSDEQALMGECLDSDATQGGTIATDPFCNPIYGFDNMNALQNTTPDQVVDYMTSNGYIDDNGNPTSTGVNYAQYVSNCFTNTSSDVISSLVDNSLPSSCFDQSKSGLTQQQYDMFHLYYIDKGIIDQMDNPYNQDAGGSSTAPQGNGNLPQGSTQDLMKQLLASPNIQFQTPTDKGYAEEIAQTGHATTCGSPAISPLLLSYLVYASQQFKITIGVFTDGHACGDGFHSRGIAVDLNGIADASQPFVSSIPGSGVSNAGGSYTDKTESEEIVKFEMYLDAAVQPKHLRFNQAGCVENGGVTPAKTVNALNLNLDSCTHLHMDTWVGGPYAPAS